ncbi:MAG TPA: YcnI family protein [Actinophytocola sp.]|uniref:YcnI family copper-binding membrane protein n=1 Tax=Actinophytocola sp. TaxID=1872138 RepID=UPI002DB6822D|nr:YcnI family protein [Actinophytocola sp.]HEU5473176.1 YcnI family protein [Actinophytocola sp.]
MSTKRLSWRFARAGAVLTAAGLALLLGTGSAAAHVTARVIGEPAAQGGFTKITFRVPNEDNTAGTVMLAVKFPPDTPIASLRTKPVPGWTAVITRAPLPTPVKTEEAEITEAVSTITWTAAPGVRINPGEFQEFEVSGGPLPHADKLVMPAVQTYDSGKVVSWDAPPPAEGAEEPEHPAPVLALSAASGSEHGAAPAGDQNAQTDVTNAASSSSTASGETDTTARWLAGLGLAVGALGLGVAAGVLIRTRRTTPAAKPTDGS